MDVFNNIADKGTDFDTFEDLLYCNDDNYGFLISLTKKIKTYGDFESEQKIIESISSNTEFKIVTGNQILASENKKIDFLKEQAHVLGISSDEVMKKLKQILSVTSLSAGEAIDELLPMMVKVSKSKSDTVIMFPDSNAHDVTIKYLNMLMYSKLGDISVVKFTK
jgi:hypothetical protein